MTDTTPTPTPTPTTTSSALFDSLFSPGLNNPTHRVMNQCFYGLFFTLTSLLVLTRGNVHVVFLLVVAVALWASVNWFLAELAKMPPSVRQTQQMPSVTGGDAGGDAGKDKSL